MKIGILTYHRAHNYGAYLQACALCNRLNQEPDMEAEIIDFRMDKESARYSYDWSAKKRILHYFGYCFLNEKQKGFQRALEDPVMTRSEPFMQSDSLQDFQNYVKGRYDVIVAGSDEIWNFNNFRGFPNPYWLLGDLGCRKVSYAASSRQDFRQLSKEDKDLLRENLLQFAYIGVRDQLTYDAIRDLLGTEEKLHLCCDPSFLYDFQVKKRSVADFVENNPRYSPKKKNAFVMTGNRKLAKYLYQKLHHAYNLISVCDRQPKYINVPNLTPREWLELMNGCDIVLTTYFHATCFSIILEKPFLSFGSNNRSSKIEAVLDSESLSKHYIKDTDMFVHEDGWDRVAGYSEALEGCQDYVSLNRRGFEQFIKELRNNAVKQTQL